MDSITLESSDHKKFEIDRGTVKYIGMINDMLQSLGDAELDNGTIKIPRVNSFMLDKVLKWAAYCKNEEQAAVKDTNFESDFVKENKEALYELINTANFLDFPDMLESLCRSVALRMKNKTSEDLRREFHITES